MSLVGLWKQWDVDQLCPKISWTMHSITKQLEDGPSLNKEATLKKSLNLYSLVKNLTIHIMRAWS